MYVERIIKAAKPCRKTPTEPVSQPEMLLVHNERSFEHFGPVSASLKYCFFFNNISIFCLVNVL